MIPFTKKYSPKSLSEVVGQQAPCSKLRDFVENFKSQKKKCIFVTGPVGCGKSSAVTALANEMGYELLEINASDTRNAAAIEEIVGNAIKTKSFFFKGKIIMIDEAEGITGTKDRGGLPTLAKLIEKTTYPVFIIANDAYDKKFSGIRKKCQIIEFNQLSVEDVFTMISKISEKEGIETENAYLKTIARRTGGDARAAITDVQVLGVDGKITKNEIEALAYREREESIREALIKIFKASDPKIAIHAFDRVDEAQDKLILWVEENLPYEYKDKESLAEAYDKLSKADIFQRRIMKRQDWRFLVYINALMTAGVAVSKNGKNRSPIEYKQNPRLLKIWMMNQKYAKRKAIAEKIALQTHSSASEAVHSTIPYLKVIFQKNKEMAGQLAEELDLNKEEIAWLEK